MAEGMHGSDEKDDFFTIPRGFSKQFRFFKGSLNDRLSLFLPEAILRDAVIESKLLSANANFVNYVKQHTIRHVESEKVIVLVEKSIKKIAFIPSAERWFYCQRGVFKKSKLIRHPRCVAVIETAFESIVFTKFIRGVHPRLKSVVKSIGAGIAEQEIVSHAYLQRRGGIEQYRVDMFRFWFMLRDRYSYNREINKLLVGLRGGERLDVEESIRLIRNHIDRLRLVARGTPKCVSHLDYLKKNILLNKRGLHLIDWSEVRIGRVGFDAGAYLANLFRREEGLSFCVLFKGFVSSYLQAVGSEFDVKQVKGNLFYCFLNGALWHTVRPENFISLDDSSKSKLLLRLSTLRRCLEDL